MTFQLLSLIRCNDVIIHLFWRSWWIKILIFLHHVFLSTCSPLLFDKFDIILKNRRLWITKLSVWIIEETIVLVCRRRLNSLNMMFQVPAFLLFLRLNFFLDRNYLSVFQNWGKFYRKLINSWTFIWMKLDLILNFHTIYWWYISLLYRHILVHVVGKLSFLTDICLKRFELVCRRCIFRIDDCVYPWESRTIFFWSLLNHLN